MPKRAIVSSHKRYSRLVSYGAAVKRQSTPPPPPLGESLTTWDRLSDAPNAIGNTVGVDNSYVHANALPSEYPGGKTDMEERRMLVYLSKGDSQAFWVLWEGHQKYLFGICLKQMGGIREDAEDALSRAMLRAWDRLPDYADKITNLKAWLTRLVQNLCIDIHRERKRSTGAALNIEEINLRDDNQLSRPNDSPESAILKREIDNYIRFSVADLPAPLREPFKMRFFDELEYRDIAERLTLTTDNARKRVQQARAILRQRLNGYFTGVCTKQIESNS